MHFRPDAACSMRVACTYCTCLHYKSLPRPWPSILSTCITRGRIWPPRLYCICMHACHDLIYCSCMHCSLEVTGDLLYCACMHYSRIPLTSYMYFSWTILGLTWPPTFNQHAFLEVCPDLFYCRGQPWPLILYICIYIIRGQPWPPILHMLY